MLASTLVSATDDLVSATDDTVPEPVVRARDPSPSGSLIRAADAPRALLWRGIAVTPEFQRYADRVASGERCPPFCGQVLARPSREFPWDLRQNSALARADHRWSFAQSALFVVLLLGVLFGGATTLFDARGRQPAQGAPASQAPLGAELRPGP